MNLRTYANQIVSDRFDKLCKKIDGKKTFQFEHFEYNPEEYDADKGALKSGPNATAMRDMLKLNLDMALSSGSVAGIGLHMRSFVNEKIAAKMEPN